MFYELEASAPDNAAPVIIIYQLKTYIPITKVDAIISTILLSFLKRPLTIPNGKSLNIPTTADNLKLTKLKS